ncbi:unnamed protein product [Gadus morhua 'NCC']
MKRLSPEPQPFDPPVTSLAEQEVVCFDATSQRKLVQILVPSVPGNNSQGIQWHCVLETNQGVAAVPRTVSSTLAWISKASAPPRKPLSMGLTFSPLLLIPRSPPPLRRPPTTHHPLAWPPAPPAATAYHLVQFARPEPPLPLKLQLLDLASGPKPSLTSPQAPPSPPMSVLPPQHGWTYPGARCGPMWHGCPV